jgi:ABC-type multidrug transport system ATPase subunit
MEEAESLCDRIGIITKGNLRTVGDQFRLKDIYGKGYFISISLELEKKMMQLGTEEDENDMQGNFNNSHVSIMT